MTSAADFWQLWCVGVDERGVVHKPLFKVTVSPKLAVHDVMDEIQQQPSQVPPMYIEFYKVVTPISALLRDVEIQATVADFSFQERTEPPNKDHDAVLLHPAEVISTYWESKPDLQYVHIIARYFQTASGTKRLREASEADINFKRLKSAIGGVPPSSLGRPANFQEIAGETQFVALNRPFEPNAIPLALFDQAFGIFRDRCKGPPSDDALACLYELSIAGCRWYPEEKLRRDAIAPVLSKYLGLELHTGTVPNTEYITNGNLSVNIMPALIRECKNESGVGLNEAIAYYGNYLLNALKDYSEYNTRFPCLLFVDVGTHVGFYGAVWDGLRIRVEPLTRGFDLMTPWKEKEDRYKMASILDALVETARFIENHYASIVKEKSLKLRRQYPFLSSYRDDVEQRDIGFTYGEQLGEDKLLFSAVTDSIEFIVIKFTTQYSVDAHKYLARLGLAPRIRQSVRISADWFAIIMDWSDYTNLYEFGSHLSELQRDKVRSRVLDIVQELHRGCFVHGDIRDTNLLVDIDSLVDEVVQIHLVDFDWAGRIGEARYPYGLNYTTVKRPKEVTSGGLIAEQHDIDM
ncbi:hypothetical protein C0993_003959, partial [Termitomyces sp. T159_Od127]